MTDTVAWMDGQWNLYRYPDDADRNLKMWLHTTHPEPEDVVAYHADGSRTVRIKLKREWVGLTGVEINHIFAANVGYPERMMKEVAKLLKEKNT